MKQETTNYNMFKTSAANRNNRQKLLKKTSFDTLKNRIKEVGQLEPIKVTNDMLIIDGQTRFEACIQLGIPVKYEILNKTKKEGLDFMRESGITARKWTSLDIVNFHAVLGFVPYQKVQTVLSKTGIRISYLNKINLLANGTAIAPGTDEFNYGKLQDFDENTLIEYLLIVRPLILSKLFSSMRVVINCLEESVEKQGLLKTKETFRVIAGNLSRHKNKITKYETTVKLTMFSSSKGKKHKFEFSSEMINK